jgi:alpha-L-rhamnosidase
MISFNHYAYGAVAQWLYDTVTGINVDMTKSLGEQFVLAPRPGGGLAWAQAELETLFGRLAMEWRIADDKLALEATVPPGATARLYPPPGYRADGVDTPIELAAGRHAFTFGRSPAR